MFNYLFVIFCFGLVITGIVYLGILQAADQAKNADFATNNAGDWPSVRVERSVSGL